MSALGVEPIELAPAATTPCLRPVLVVGERGLWSVASGRAAIAAGPTSDDALAQALRPLAESWTGGLEGAYNGPGGEAHFRWELGTPRPVLFDRRASLARLRAVLALAESTYTGSLAIGGVDARGDAVCFVLPTRSVFAGPGEDSVDDNGRAYDAAADAAGGLRSDHLGVPFVVEAGGAPWPGQEGERIPVRVHRERDTGVAALLHAASLAASSERWPVLVDP